MKPSRLLMLASLLLLTFLLAACSEGLSDEDVQATVVAAAQATVLAQPTSTPFVQIVETTPGPTSTPVIIEREVQVVVTPTPGPTATPVVIERPVVATATPQPTPRVVGASASIRADNSLIAMIDVELDNAAKVYVEYENADVGKFRSMTTINAELKHAVPVLRLRSETTYDYTVFALDSGGNAIKGPSGSFTTGALPPELATMQVTVEGNPTSDLVMMDYVVSDKSFLYIVDDESRIVWYYLEQNLIEASSSPNILGVRRKPNGNIMYIDVHFSHCCITEITPLGELVSVLTTGDVTGAPHHDFDLLSDYEVLYLSDETRTIDDSANGGNAEQRVVGDTLKVWDQRTGLTKEVWSAFDTWDVTNPEQRVIWTGDPIRWTHFNSIEIGPRGNIIVSSRNRNQVVSITPDFTSLEWELGLGDSGGPNTDFTYEKLSDRFYRQHTASELRTGNVLIFDNGDGRPEDEGGEFSRAIELLLDNYDTQAVKVWEFNPGIYSAFISSAYRLENGNTLVNFGASVDWETVPISVFEVERDGDVVWRYDTIDPPRVQGVSPRRFRAYAEDSIMGELKLQ